MPTKSKQPRPDGGAKQPPTAAAQATAQAATQYDLAGLGNAIRRLGDKAPVERARQAKVLLVAAQRLLADAHREAIYEATRGQSYEEVAAALGVTPGAVNLAVTNHRKAHPEMRVA